MPYSRPSLQTLVDRVQASINANLPGADSRPRRSILGVLANTLAAAAHGLYGYINWVSQQLFPDSAEGESLERWANVWGLTRRAATFAAGTVTVTGTPGAAIPTGTKLQRTDATLYTITTGGTLPGGGSLALPVTCDVPGVVGNTAAAQVLTLATPLVGVTPTATVVSLTGGAEAEDDEALRDRLLSFLQARPQGGARSDYVTWAQTVPGVTRAWVWSNDPSTAWVTVRFAMDDAYANGIPQPADVTAVANAINALRPITARVLVQAPTSAPVNFTITLPVGDTPEVRAAITAELRDLIRREGEPGGTLLISHIREAISTATGELDHVLVSPAYNVSFLDTELPTLGTVTFT